jgi:hypothetical protein
MADSASADVPSGLCAVEDVPIRFESLPGEYLQRDWGEIRHFHSPS